MGTHLVGRRTAGFRLLVPALAAMAVLIGTTAHAVPAAALGSPVLLTITVSPTTANVPAGETQQFTATGHYSNLSTANLTDTATWSSSLTSSGTVSNASGSQGLATAVATGATTITATDGLILGTAVMTVISPVLLTVTVSPTVSNIDAGDSEQFTATGHLSNGSLETLTNTVTWASTETQYATVSNASGSQGDVTAVATGATVITATDPSNAIAGTAAVTVLPAVLLAITVSPPVANIPAGDSEQFAATGQYSDGSTQNITDSVTWATSSSTVATVSNTSGSQGEVTAVGTGGATITASDPSASTIFGVSAVTVIPAVLLAVTVSPLAANVPAGDTEQYTATGHYSDGSTQNLTDSVTWASSATADATVSNTSGSQGLVTGVAEGASVITATYESSDTVGTAAVTVIPAVLVAITVSPTLANVPAGDTQQFTAKGLYSDGSTENLTDSVTWASSETQYATVSNSAGSQGLVTGVAEGASTISATDPTTQEAGEAAVTVLPAVLVAISVSPVATDIPAGEADYFAATGLYSDGSTENLTDSVTWASSETQYVTVSNAPKTDGLVTAVAIGASTISATDPTTQIAGEAAVTVLPAVLVAITVNPAVKNIPAGQSDQFEATGYYTDGSTQSLTDSVKWSTSDSSTATVSNASGSQGDVTAVSTGAVTITATDESSGVFGVAAVTVLPAVLVAISVSPAAANVPIGDTKPLTATGVYSDGSTESLTDSVTWSSSETQYATVSNTAGSQGQVTGVATGASTITATDESSGIFGVAAVTVLPAVLVAITVSPITASVALYGTQQFTAEGIYSDTSTANITDSVTWSSSDDGDATISNAAGSQGLATAAATGAVVITATDSATELFGTAALDVTGATLTLTPSLGPARTHVVVSGTGFTPGSNVKVLFLTEVSARPKYRICVATVGSNGTFTCSGKIRGAKRDGAAGPHTVEAKIRHTSTIVASTIYTLEP